MNIQYVLLDKIPLEDKYFYKQPKHYAVAFKKIDRLILQLAVDHPWGNNRDKIKGKICLNT